MIELPELYEIEEQWPVLASMALIEVLLSVDNLLVVQRVAEHLPESQRKLALRIGASQVHHPDRPLVDLLADDADGALRAQIVLNQQVPLHAELAAAGLVPHSRPQRVVLRRVQPPAAFQHSDSVAPTFA